MKTSVFRKAHFNAAHRLFNQNWSEEKNFEIFDKCSWPHYHGHNYNIIIKVTGHVNQETGYLIDMKVLNRLLNENIISRFDHKNLNLDVPEFRDLNPTAENIAMVIYNIMRKEISQHLELQIRLYETERNFVEYPG